MLLKVGELAQRSGLTVRTLHHYDEIGLLKPSGRSESGYRLYSTEDVQRLHGIQALRHMGLPLAHIGELLIDQSLDPKRVLARQMHALDLQIQQATELRGRLALMHDGMVAGTKPDMGNWLETLALMSTYGKYFSTAELKRIFERWHLIEPEWVPLVALVDGVMQRGLLPDDPEVQRLANRWMVLMLEWMEGDLDLMDRWGHMYRQEPTAHSINYAPSGAMIAFVEGAIELRMAVLCRYFSREELARLGYVTMAQWQALEEEVQALLARQVAPDGPEAFQALRHWGRLMSQLSRNDAALRSKLLAASAAEPLLRSGGMLSADVREFIGRAATLAPTSALDPHVT